MAEQPQRQRGWRRTKNAARTDGAADVAAKITAGPQARAGAARALKRFLQLTADQEKYWPPIEEAIRARAKNRQSRVENLTTGVADRADRGVIEVLRDRNPVEFLDRRADVLAQRSADLKKLAAAWQPLYQTLTPVQKRNLGYLTISVLRELRDRAEERRMNSEEEDD